MADTADIEALKKIQVRIKPSARVASTVKETSTFEPIYPEGLVQGVKEGTGIPAVKRVASAMETTPLGLNFNPIKYKTENPDSSIMDMMGDLVTAATVWIPGAGARQGLVKTAGAMVTGATTGGIIGSQPEGAQKIAKYMNEHKYLQPALIAIQALTHARAALGSKNLAKTEIAEKAKNLGIPFSPEAQAAALKKEGVENVPELGGTEKKLSILYADKYNEFVKNQQDKIKSKFKTQYGNMPESFQEVGENIQQKSLAVKTKLGGKYEYIDSVLNDMKVKGIGNDAQKGLLEILKKDRILTDRKGNFIKRAGGKIPNEILPAVETLYKNLGTIKKEPMILLEELRQFTDKVDAVYSGRTNKGTVAVNSIRKMLNDKIGEAIKKQSPDDFKTWNKVRESFTINSKIDEVLFGNKKIVDINPANIYNQAFIQGTPGIDALINRIGRQEVQDATLLKLYAKAGQGEMFNGAALIKELKNPQTAGMYKYIFGQQGYNELLDFGNIVEFVTSPQRYRGTQPRGSQTAPLTETIKEIDVLNKGNRLLQRLTNAKPSFLTKDLFITAPYSEASVIAGTIGSGYARGLGQEQQQQIQDVEALRKIRERIK